MNSAKLKAQNDAFAAALKRAHGPKPHLQAAPKAPAPRALQPHEIVVGDGEIGGALVLDLVRLMEGRLLIQGVSGAGKSWTLRRLLEQSAGRVQQIIVDPEGEFQSLTEELKHLHVDCAKLSAKALGQLAARIRAHRLSVVLDMSDLSREAQMQAVASLLHALIDAPREQWAPALVAVDEAHLFAPFGGIVADTATRKAAVGAVVDLMSRGRKRGLAGVLATQRLARLSKSVASEVQNFLIGMNTLDLDVKRAAETIGWTVRRASDRLPLLTPGNFVAVGLAFSNSPAIVKVGEVKSRHIGATPVLAAPPAMSADQVRELAGVEELVAQSEQEPADAPARTRGRGYSFTEQDDEVIKAGLLAGKPIREIQLDLESAGRPVRSPSQITQRGRMLGIGARTNMWSPEEDQIVIDGYRNGTKLIDIATQINALGRRMITRQAVQMRAIALGVTCDRVNYWTPEETKIALDLLRQGRTSAEVITALREAGYHRGDTALNKFRKKHGLQKPHEKIWTAQEVDILKQAYAAGEGPKGALKKLPRWTYQAIVQKANALQISTNRVWPNEHVAILQDAHDRGGRLVDVAGRLQRPYANVAAMARRMGLRFRSERRPAK